MDNYGFPDNVIDNTMAHISSTERTDPLIFTHSTARTQRIPLVLTFKKMSNSLKTVLRQLSYLRNLYSSPTEETLLFRSELNNQANRICGTLACNCSTCFTFKFIKIDTKSEKNSNHRTRRIFFLLSITPCASLQVFFFQLYIEKKQEETC